jgi:hypothetical protein
VKRITGIFLLSVYLFSFAEMHNFFKLPVLFKHFQEHRKEDKSLSFWKYLNIHYTEPLQVDEDYHRDNQLPFRDADCGLIAATTVCECLPFTVGISPLAETARDYPLYFELDFPPANPFGIFQPPRSA